MKGYEKVRTGVSACCHQNRPFREENQLQWYIMLNMDVLYLLSVDNVSYSVW